VWPEGLGKFEKIHHIGMRSQNLPACSIVPQPLRYRVPPDLKGGKENKGENLKERDILDFV
jgi:hypothetical protein